ncbi:glutathione S-transferase T3-like [Coffea eugenioides]|uniref:glutathione S-transferase T3-like n=1 Tax=Coffea eugenioides TaxID=49369 RepID=UPI000F606A4A|nr:glutathione S-transferase T3-like [Coffea eugenioides]
MGCEGLTTLSEIRKDFDFAGQQDNATPTESISDSQFPPYSTQCEVENINLTNEAVEKPDGKRVPWSVDDDKILACAWLTISNCSIVGNFQNEESFWKRVVDYFNENRKSGPPRKYKAVKSHWHWLSRMVNEFNQYYNRLWKVNAPMQRSSKKIRTNENGAYTSSSNADSNFDIDDNEAREVRPPGQKASKKGKRKAKSKVNEENVSGEFDQIRKMLMQQKEEKLQAMENLANKLESYNFRSDYEILLKDTTGMTYQPLRIHEQMFSILKAKYNIS